MPALYSHTTRANGTVLTATVYNGDHQNHIDNGIPTQHDDYSASVAQMKINTDPGESGTESQATSLAGEIERLRFAIKECKGTAEWYQTPSQNLNGIIIFAAGTEVLFHQTAAPTGWTKVTTHNDKALRVVSGTVGSGGATAFTSVFGAGKVTGSTAITEAQMPSHVHGVNDPGHTHAGNYQNNSASGIALTVGTGLTISGIPGAATGISIQAAGSSAGHTHTESLDLQYVDVIIASKN